MWFQRLSKWFFNIVIERMKVEEILSIFSDIADRFLTVRKVTHHHHNIKLFCPSPIRHDFPGHQILKIYEFLSCASYFLFPELKFSSQVVLPSGKGSLGYKYAMSFRCPTSQISIYKLKISSWSFCAEHPTLTSKRSFKTLEKKSL